MAVLGINYSQQIKEKGHLLQNARAGGRGAFTALAITESAVLTTLAPSTGGLTLIPAIFMARGAIACAEDTFTNEDFVNLNNNKGATIKLTEEITESNNKLGKSYSSESNDLIAQIEVPAYIPTDRCNIM